MAHIYRAAFIGVHQPEGTLIVNTFHFKSDGVSVGTPDPGIGTVADYLAGAPATKWRGMAWSTTVLDRIEVREEVAPGSGDVPAQAERAISGSGALTPSGDKIPLPLCVHVKLATDAAVRSGHGGFFAPPLEYKSQLDSNGLVAGTGAIWGALNTFTAELLAGHDVGIGGADGHISLVVYSRTRRARGLDNYYFDVTGAVRNPVPSFLRSRGTSP